MKLKILGLFLALSLIAVNCYAGDLKIGVVEMDNVLKNSREVLNSKGKLRDKFNRLQGDLNEREKTLKASIEEFKAQSALYSEEAKREKETALKKEEENLVNTFKEYQDDIKRNEQELVKAVIDRVGAISKELGYSLVIEKKSGFIIYADPELDISKEVIEVIDNPKEETK